MNHLQVRVVEATADQVTTEMTLEPWMLQQTQVAHAGIVTAIADHTAACAARVHERRDESYVSISVHTTLIRPAAGPILRTIGTPVRSGRRVSFARAEVYSGDGITMKLCATFDVSLIKAPAPPPTQE